MVAVAIANRQRALPIDRPIHRRLVKYVLSEEGVNQAEISLAFVSNAEIWEINRQYLNHDYATDVITFPFMSADRLSGELVISAEYAAEVGPDFGHQACEELMLYVVHGLLHLTGYDDKSPAKAKVMSRRQSQLLAGFVASDSLLRTRPIGPTRRVRPLR
jgi:probable rRNA maturation factor